MATYELPALEQVVLHELSRPDGHWGAHVAKGKLFG